MASCSGGGGDCSFWPTSALWAKMARPELFKTEKVIQPFGWNLPILKYAVGASLVAQMVKNLPAMWENWARSLSWEDPLEEGMTTHSSILPWKIPVDREAWWATVHGVVKSRT